jgi:hypothetical protein
LFVVLVRESFIVFIGNRACAHRDLSLGVNV